MTIKINSVNETKYSFKISTNKGIYYIYKRYAKKYFNLDNENKIKTLFFENDLIVKEHEITEFTASYGNVLKRITSFETSKILMPEDYLDDIDSINYKEEVNKNYKDLYDFIDKEEFKIFKKKYFSPFNNIEGVSDNNINLNLIVNSFNLPFDEIKNEAILCVIQNFINREDDAKTLLGKKSSSLYMSLILEVLKYYRNEVIYISSPKKYRDIFNDSIEELKKVVDLFVPIVEEDISWINKQLEFFSFVDDDSFSISLEEQSLATFKITNDKFKSINFISKKNVKYKKIFENKQPIKKIVDGFHKILEIAFDGSYSHIKTFKHEQLLALEKILSDNQSILAVLKTGFGKSLIYQFSSLMQPCIVITIFPIVSLIDDQYITMEQEYGFNFVMSNQDIKNFRGKDIELFSNKRVFYLTAERLEKKREQNMFNKFSEFVGMMIFDEAHTISEWGHDFRPAYLISRYMLKNIGERTSNLKTIALTATAAPHVQRDILKLLDIPQANLINIADESGLERNELEFNIMKIIDTGNPLDTWLDLSINKIKENSKTDGVKLYYLLQSGGNKYYFRWMNALNLYEKTIKLIPQINLGIYTGKDKKINNDNNNELKTFKDFKKVKSIVATKSFGMGINLLNCNYVALLGAPSSLEDLYQQSGRAGRKGQSSKIEIFFTDNNLSNPSEKKTGNLNWILAIKEERKLSQEYFLLIILKIFEEAKFQNISIHLPKLINLVKNDLGINIYNSNLQTNFKFAISHLISEFKIIKNYTVEYRGLTINKIDLYIEPNIKNIDDALASILKINANLMLIKKDDLFKNIQDFYKWYFSELQKQKVIGFNIMAKEFQKLNPLNQANNSKEIYDMLNEYYRKRDETVYTGSEQIYNLLMKKNITVSEIVNKIDIITKIQNINDFNEITSRHNIDREYTLILALILKIYFDVDPLISSVEDLWKNSFKTSHLTKLKHDILGEQIEKNTKYKEDAIINFGDEELLKLYISNKIMEEI